VFKRDPLEFDLTPVYQALRPFSRAAHQDLGAGAERTNGVRDDVEGDQRSETLPLLAVREQPGFLNKLVAIVGEK
jgi:hypothetical protein